MHLRKRLASCWRTRRVAILPVLAALPSICGAAAVSVQVQDSNGQPLADAAVYAEPVGEVPAPKQPKAVEIEQKNRSFIPLVTVIQTGTDIAFPNRDTVRHQVYSFSPPKPFELKLYSGTGKTVHFDKPGTVVIGCNIHDQMIGYIQVVSTPYFAKTDAAGNARLDGLPAGQYRLKAWHYRLPPTTTIPEQSLAVGDSDTSARFKLELLPSPAQH